jgi:LPXTG-motif cell wall-anchored protein
MRAKTTRRAGLLTGLCGVVIAGTALVAAPVSAGEVENIAACVSTLPTPGSENTDLGFTEYDGDTSGGSATFDLTFPGIEGVDSFEVDGCVFVDGVAIGWWGPRTIPNGETVPLAITVPAAAAGAEVCVTAKTTAGPSAPGGSNRKAKDCFTIPVVQPSEEPSEEPSEQPSEEVSEEPTEQPSEEPSEEPSETASEEPSVEPSGATPSISPTVKGVKIVRRPTAPMLPNTGSPASVLVVAGVALALAGSVLVFGAGRYQRQH